MGDEKGSERIGALRLLEVVGCGDQASGPAFQCNVGAERLCQLLGASNRVGNFGLWRFSGSVETNAVDHA